MIRHIDEEERKVWEDLSKDLERAYSLVAAAHYKAITELEHDCSKNARNRIGHAKEVLSGLSYLFKPQSEWTGGDSEDPANFKVRAPHISD